MRTRVGTFSRYLLGTGLGPFLVRTTAGSGVIQAAGLLVTFLVGVQLARGLGVEGYGYYAIAMAVITLAAVPGEFGFPKLVMREVAASTAIGGEGRVRSVLRWADRNGLALGIASAAGIALIALAVAGPDSTAAAAILWGTPIIPLVAVARNRGAALQGLHHIVLGQAPFLLLRPLAFALLLFLLFTLLPGAGAPQAMALNAVTALFAAMLGHFWLRTRLPPNPPAPAPADRRWLKSAMSMALADGLRLGHFQLTTVLLGVLATAFEVGLFRIATSTVAIIALPIMLVSIVGVPVVARLHAEGDGRRLQQLCTRSAQVMTVAVAMLSLPFLFWGEPLFAFVFGAEYAPANAALLILAGGQVGTAAFGLNAGLLTMTGHEGRVARAMFWGLLAGVVLTFVLVPTMGEIGAALATIGALLVWNIMTWMDARRLLGIQTSLIPARRADARSDDGSAQP